MNWQSILDNFNQPFASTVGQSNDPYNFNRMSLVKTIPTATGEMAVIRNGYGQYQLLLPDGKMASSSAGINLTEQSANDPTALQRVVDQAVKYAQGEYMKDSKGNYVPKIIAPNGTAYPVTDYTNQGATYAANGQPTQNTPTSGPGTATPTPAAPPASTGSTTNIATVPNSTNNLPAGYKVTGQEPSGWATGPDGHMIKISDIPGASTANSGATGSNQGASSGTYGQPITLSNGQTISPQDPNYATYASQAGIAAPTDTGSTITGDPAAQRAALTAAGIDSTLLSDSQVSSLYLMQSYSDAQAKADKQIAPASLSQADMDKFLSDAKAEYAPYYAEQFDIAKANLIQATGVLTGDNSYAEQQMASSFTNANEDAAKQAADAGLARSGIRQLAEARLAEQQTGMVESGRRKLKSDVYQLGSTFEQTYGADKLAQAGTPSVNSQGFAGLGIAPTTVGYNATGIQLGTMGAAQEDAVRVEQARLAQLEASKRLNNAYGATATNLP